MFRSTTEKNQLSSCVAVLENLFSIPTWTNDKFATSFIRCSFLEKLWPSSAWPIDFLSSLKHSPHAHWTFLRLQHTASRDQACANHVV